ncbi:MAG: outer membrane beta-barrel protein [Calditrichaeota bacterium]|nr:outer membrane beta-barrel protein [Calditrichota bacterium]
MSGFFKITIILVFFSLQVNAQQSDKVKFELSPHTGFMDGSGQFGLDASMNYKSFNLEFSGAQVIGETADLYPLNVNLLFNLATKGKMIPYGGVGVGLLLTVPSTTIGNKTLSNIGMNFGGGVRFYFTDTFGVRLGANQFLTNIKNKRDENEELLIFQEVTLGVIFVFK